MKLDTLARYSRSDEWVRPEGNLMVFGLTDHAQEELSDIVYVELPDPGAEYQKGDAVGVVESVKAASDIYLPMAGLIVEVNEALNSSPDAINHDPYGEGWLFKFEPVDPAEWQALLSCEDYAGLVEA